MEIEEWIIDNLNEFGNVALPPKLCSKYPIEDVQKEIEKLFKGKIRIVKSDIEMPT